MSTQRSSARRPFPSAGEEADRFRFRLRQHPVVFTPGLWLLPSSWDNWRDLFKMVLRAADAGLAGRSGHGPSGSAEPEVLAKKSLKQVADHTTAIINALDKKPAVIGHLLCGLLTPIAGRGSLGGDGSDPPGVFRGVLAVAGLGSQARGAIPDLPPPPRRAITLTFAQPYLNWSNVSVIARPRVQRVDQEWPHALENRARQRQDAAEDPGVDGYRRRPRALGPRVSVPASRRSSARSPLASCPRH